VGSVVPGDFRRFCCPNLMFSISSSLRRNTRRFCARSELTVCVFFRGKHLFRGKK
jgi:hypothetical protein